MSKEIERTYLLQHFTTDSNNIIHTANANCAISDMRFTELLVDTQIKTVYMSKRSRARMIDTRSFFSILPAHMTEKNKWRYGRMKNHPACIIGKQYYKIIKTGTGMVREEVDELLSYDEYNITKMIESGMFFFTTKSRIMFKGVKNKYAIDWNAHGITDIVFDKYYTVGKNCEDGPVGHMHPGKYSVAIGVEIYNNAYNIIPEWLHASAEGAFIPMKLEIEFKDVESAEKFNVLDHIILKEKVLEEITDNEHYSDYGISKWSQQDFKDHTSYVAKLIERKLNVNFGKCQ